MVRVLPYFREFAMTCSRQGHHPVDVGRELNLRHIADDLTHVLEFGGEQFWCPGVAVMLCA
jgi:hypothetical protein